MLSVHQNQRSIKTSRYGEYYDVTEILEEELEKSGFKTGILCLNCQHTTAAITMQEPDPTVQKDGVEVLNKIVPVQQDYHHNYEGNINGAAHQKQMLIGSSISVPVTEGELALGTWQRVFLVELFQPMTRKILITIIGE